MSISSFSQRHGELNQRIILTIATATSILLSLTLIVVMWRYLSSGQRVYGIRVLWNLAMLAVTIGAAFLARRQRWAAAAYVYIFGETALLFGYPIALQIGVHAIGLYALSVMILLSAFLFHPRFGLFSALFFSLCFASVLMAEQMAWIDVSRDNFPDSVLITVAVISMYVLIGWLSFRYSSLYRSNFEQLLAEQQSLLQALQALRVRESKLLQMQAALIQADAAKSQFLTMMSHELRTPLNGIIGAAQLLQDETSIKNESYVNAIHQSGEHLAELIENVLQYSQLELGDTETQAVVFSPLRLLQNVCKHFSVIAQQKGLQIDVVTNVAADRYINADERRIKMILHHLLNNAIKFTERGCVTLTSSCSAQHDKIEFAVRDTGIGLASEQIKNIFEPFTQIEAGYNRRFGGIGIGLTLAHLNLKLLGSQLEVDSRPGEGSCFRFTIAIDEG